MLQRGPPAHAPQERSEEHESLALRLLSCLRMGCAPQNQPEAQLFSWYQKILALRWAVSLGWASLRRWNLLARLGIKHCWPGALVSASQRHLPGIGLHPCRLFLAGAVIMAQPRQGLHRRRNTWHNLTQLSQTGRRGIIHCVLMLQGP